MTDTHDTNLPDKAVELEEDKKTAEVSEPATTETSAEATLTDKPAESVQKLTKEEILNKLKEIATDVENAAKSEIDSLKQAFYKLHNSEQEAAKKDLVMPILLEVNVAEEESKFGLTTNEVLPLLEKISIFSHIKVMGLMTIAPFVKNPEENREIFRTLKKLSVDINAKNINNVNMSVLSMGMTGDYEVAVEEGATLVRVGTGIFGERNYSI